MEIKRLITIIGSTIFTVLTVLMVIIFLKVDKGNNEALNLVNESISKVSNKEVLSSKTNGNECICLFDNQSTDYHFDANSETNYLNKAPFLNSCIEILEKYEKEKLIFLNANDLM